MGKWIWPEGLKPLWEDSVTDKEKMYKQGKELEDAISKYYAEHGGGDTIVNDPERLAELDEREAESVRNMASEYMARNRIPLIDRFMESDLAKAALANKKDPEELREWAGELLGLGSLKPSAIEDAVAKSLKGDRSILDALPVDAKRALYQLAYRDAFRESEANLLNGQRAREMQGYNRLLAELPLEDWQVRNKMRSLESYLLDNMANGRGAVVPVYGGGEVEIPGLGGMDMSSLDDRILMRMLDEFRTSGYLPNEQATGKTDSFDDVREHDKVYGAITGKADAVLPAGKEPDSGEIVTAVYGPDKKPLKEYMQDVGRQWLADPLYKEAHDSYFSNPKSPLPEDWEKGYPFAIYGLDGSSNIIVFEEDGSLPFVLTEDDADYRKFKPYVYVPGKGQVGKTVAKPSLEDEAKTFTYEDFERLLEKEAETNRDYMNDPFSVGRRGVWDAKEARNKGELLLRQAYPELFDENHPLNAPFSEELPFGVLKKRLLQGGESEKKRKAARKRSSGGGSDGKKEE